MYLGSPVDAAVHTVFFGIKAGDGITPGFQIGGRIHVKAAGPLAKVCGTGSVHIVGSILIYDEGVADIDIRALHKHFSPYW